jgi:IS30 family transposase
MMGKDRKGAVLVMTDRATLHTRLRKLRNKDAVTVQRAALCILESNSYPVQTLTFDNDKTFSCPEEISSQFNIRSYFTRPYTSQDKGTVENRIGVIRRFIPKVTDLTTISQRQISQVENLINNRPVRKFKYLTPNQVLHGKIALIC